MALVLDYVAPRTVFAACRLIERTWFGEYFLEPQDQEFERSQYDLLREGLSLFSAELMVMVSLQRQMVQQDHDESMVVILH